VFHVETFPAGLAAPSTVMVGRTGSGGGPVQMTPLDVMSGSIIRQMPDGQEYPDDVACKLRGLTKRF
jgi:hypothetical protein